MASIPDIVSNLYKTYKHDQNLFTSWLGETAAKCNVFPASKITISGSKPKPALGKKQKGNRPKNETRYTIGIREYTRLAEGIVLSNTPVPMVILRGLRRIIAKRRECSFWYAQTVDVDGPDEGHLHAIKVLQETFEILVVNAKDDKVGAAEKTESRSKPSNVFATLEDLEQEDDISDIESNEVVCCLWNSLLNLKQHCAANLMEC